MTHARRITAVAALALAAAGAVALPAAAASGSEAVSAPASAVSGLFPSSDSSSDSLIGDINLINIFIGNYLG